MIIYPCAEFTSDLPEDFIETDDGEVLETGGRSVMAAIAEMLKDLGGDVEPPENADDHGWSLAFKWRTRKFWFEVVLIEGYILQTLDNSFFSKHLKKNKEIYAEMLTQFAQALDKDPRFKKVRWCARDEVQGDGPGMKSPVSLDLPTPKAKSV